MNHQDADTVRVAAEYERRGRDISRDFYSLGKPGNLLMYQQTVRSCIAALQEASLFPLRGRRVADIGCGSGSWLLEFVQWGADPADVAGIDLMENRLQEARTRIPQADLRVGSASELPWPDESFDVVSQFLVFTNMFDSVLQRAIANEMLRVLRPGGAVLWFDMRMDNPNNPEVKGLRRKEIASLFPGCEIHLRAAILAPPLARSIAGRWWTLGEALHIISLLRTHYAGWIRKQTS